MTAAVARTQDMKSFQNKVAIVTGGSTGLGEAFVRELVAQGARVVIVDIDEPHGLALAAETGAEFRRLSVADLQAFQQLIAEVHGAYGSLDLIINNAGISAGGESLDVPLEEWRRVLEVNLLGVIAGSLAAFQIMSRQRSGWILNIGSLTGLALTPMLLPYSSSKAGVVTFSRGLAEEAVAFGVHVAVGCPGNVQTKILPSHVSGLMKIMQPDYAVRRMLRMLLARKRILVFPAYARLWWLCDRLSPQLLAPFRQIIVKRARERARVASTPGPKGLSPLS